MNKEGMSMRRVLKTKTCSIGHVTDVQIYDFKNKCWIYYCEKCQETVDDPNGI